MDFEEHLRLAQMIPSTSVESLLDDPIGHYPAATVACFDPTTGDLPRRSLDGERTVTFLERLAAAGAPALLIAASTGHGHLRTIAEVEAWFRVAAHTQLGATVLTALLRPEDGEKANHKLARLLASLGYAAAFVRPGRDLSPQAPVAEVVANMQPVVATIAEAGLAV